MIAYLNANNILTDRIGDSKFMCWVCGAYVPEGSARMPLEAKKALKLFADKADRALRVSRPPLCPGVVYWLAFKEGG
jgi:hypothetical protein